MSPRSVKQFRRQSVPEPLRLAFACDRPGLLASLSEPLRVYTACRRRSARFQKLAACLYRYVAQEPWNEEPSLTHHNQAVMLSGYAKLYDELAGAIDRAAVVADSNRLVSTHLTAAVREGRRHLTLEPNPLPAFLQDRLRHLVLHFIEEEVPEF